MTYLKKLRAACSNQDAFAYRVGCGQGLVSRWLSGGIIPGPGYYEALRRVAGITAEELVAAKVAKLATRRRFGRRRA